MGKKSLELVTWYDIVGDARWDTDVEPKKCLTAGWVIREGPDYLVIASSKSGRVFGDKTAIPLGCVASRQAIHG